MSSEWKPNTPPDDAPAGGTMVAVPRFAAAQPAAPGPAAPVAGGTMVGVARVGAPQFGSMAMPRPAGGPDQGGTMVGMAPVGAFGGGFGAPAAMPRPAAGHEVGGTMVGMARVGSPAPQAFGAPPFTPGEGGGTMVGLARVGAPAPGVGHAAPAEVGGTMVGMARVGAEAQGFGLAAPAAARPTGPPPDYEILAHLGGGELGQVFHARHRENGADYALRIIRPDIAAVPGAVEALFDVVALAQSAEHTHLGRQYALDESASPTLVLEYVPGKLLSTLMKERGRPPAAAVVDLGVRLCSALAVAHGAGLAHGRLHAGNVVLESKTGRWVLLDLGHGYAVEGLEQAHDLYALGALLYEMATGHSPFGSDGVVPDPRQHRGDLPAGLSALLLRSLSPDQNLWFSSAIDFAQALARAKSMP